MLQSDTKSTIYIVKYRTGGYRLQEKFSTEAGAKAYVSALKSIGMLDERFGGITITEQRK